MSNAQQKVLEAVKASGAAGYSGKARQGRTLDILMSAGLIVHRAANADGSGMWRYFAVESL